MTEELKQEVKDILQKMSDAKVPCLFLAFDGEHFTNLRNCNLQQAAQLMINQIESSEEQNEIFVKELELLNEPIPEETDG